MVERKRNANADAGRREGGFYGTTGDFGWLLHLVQSHSPPEVRSGSEARLRSSGGSRSWAKVERRVQVLIQGHV